MEEKKARQRIYEAEQKSQAFQQVINTKKEEYKEVLREHGIESAALQQVQREIEETRSTMKDMKVQTENLHSKAQSLQRTREQLTNVRPLASYCRSGRSVACATRNCSCSL